MKYQVLKNPVEKKTDEEVDYDGLVEIVFGKQHDAPTDEEHDTVRVDLPWKPNHATEATDTTKDTKTADKNDKTVGHVCLDREKFITEIHKTFTLNIWATALAMCMVFTWYALLGYSGETAKEMHLFKYSYIVVPVSCLVTLCAFVVTAIKNPTRPYSWGVSCMYAMISAPLSLVLSCGLTFYTVKTATLEILFAVAILCVLAWYAYHTERDLRFMGQFILGCVPLFVMTGTMFVAGQPVLPLLGLIWMLQLGAMIVYQLHIQLHRPLGGLNPLVYAASLYVLVIFFIIGTMLCLHDWFQ
ncbi:membrane protein A36 [Aotine betaherpesvirus 1]|uniref:Membrane protein A36 n=1 Tax=Aotine betaherpesvirus 1 TaxID=50290 RepID=G8XUL4_9BETA|nr:membrane protein A36 [Aotine betaherpesvirus 1]AEV80856.1 membrane protein A36 [Aotine betaherpesvirus 1]